MSATDPIAQATAEQNPSTRPGPAPQPAHKKEGLVKRVINKIRSILGRKKTTEPAPRTLTPVFVDANDHQPAGAPGGSASDPPVLPNVDR